MKKTADSPILSSAVFRFGILSDLLYSDPEGSPKQNILQDLANKALSWRDGIRKQFSEEAIRKWLNRYHVSGQSALENQPGNRPIREEVNQELEDSLFKMRTKHPRWTVALMLDAVRKNEKEAGFGREILQSFNQDDKK